MSIADFERKAITGFFKNLNKTFDDVNQEVVGELNEESYLDVSYWFGNGELIASNDKYSITLAIENNSLVTLEEEVVDDLKQL